MYWGNSGNFSAEKLQETLIPLLGKGLYNEIWTFKDKPEVKQELMAQTKRATEDGAFGAPWYILV